MFDWFKEIGNLAAINVTQMALKQEITYRLNKLCRKSKKKRKKAIKTCFEKHIKNTFYYIISMPCCINIFAFFFSKITYFESICILEVTKINKLSWIPFIPTYNLKFALIKKVLENGVLLFLCHWDIMTLKYLKNSVKIKGRIRRNRKRKVKIRTGQESRNVCSLANR